MTSEVAGTPVPGQLPAASEVAWHTLGADQVLRFEGVDGQRGLSSAEAAARAQRFGPNSFAAGQSEPRWHAFVRLDVRQWLTCTAVALSIVVAAEIRKAVLRQTAAKAIHSASSSGPEAVPAGRPAAGA